MRTLQRAGAALLALAMTGALAACGDDTPAADGADGENAAFCDAVIEFNTAAFQIDLSEDSTEAEIVAAGDEVAPLSQALVDEAPDDIVAAAEAVNSFISPLLEGDAEAFNADASFETYTSFLGDATTACDFPEVKVEARDYAYRAPDTIAAGNVSFAFTNTSEGEEHEMVVLQKGDGIDLTWDELLALPEEEGQSKTKFVTVAFAPPGESGSTLAALDAGDYLMVCFVSVGGAEDGPPHFTQGMKHEFTVE